LKVRKTSVTLRFCRGSKWNQIWTNFLRRSRRHTTGSSACFLTKP